MTRPSFRPRPIDLNKPLNIIRSNADLKKEDDVVVSRALPAIKTGVDPAEEEERHLQQALLASMQSDGGKKIKLEIPVPVVKETDNYRTRDFRPFKMPEKQLIHFEKDDDEILMSSVEYEADYKDEAWIKQAGIEISVDEFECLMDKFEKIQGVTHHLHLFDVFHRQMQGFYSVDENTLKKIYEYWVVRRKENKKSFLRFFQPPPDQNDPNPAVAFRFREMDAALLRSRGRQNTYEVFKRKLRLRYDFDKLQALLLRIVKREKLKLEFARKSYLCHKLKIQSEIQKHRIEMQDNNRKKKRPLAKANETVVKDPKIDRPKPFDDFGWDEQGQQFVAGLSYFIGGFAENGVNPYDHRVYDASLRWRNKPVAENDNHLVEPLGYIDHLKLAKRGKVGPGRVYSRLGRSGRVIMNKMDHLSTSVGSRDYGSFVTSESLDDEDVADVIKYWPSRGADPSSKVHVKQSSNEQAVDPHDIRWHYVERDSQLVSIFEPEPSDTMNSDMDFELS